MWLLQWKVWLHVTKILYSPTVATLVIFKVDFTIFIHDGWFWSLAPHFSEIPVFLQNKKHYKVKKKKLGCMKKHLSLFDAVDSSLIPVGGCVSGPSCCIWSESQHLWLLCSSGSAAQRSSHSSSSGAAPSSGGTTVSEQMVRCHAWRQQELRGAWTYSESQSQIQVRAFWFLPVWQR